MSRIIVVKVFVSHALCTQSTVRFPFWVCAAQILYRPPMCCEVMFAVAASRLARGVATSCLVVRTCQRHTLAAKKVRVMNLIDDHCQRCSSSPSNVLDVRCPQVQEHGGSVPRVDLPLKRMFGEREKLARSGRPLGNIPLVDHLLVGFYGHTCRRRILTRTNCRTNDENRHTQRGLRFVHGNNHTSQFKRVPVSVRDERSNFRGLALRACLLRRFESGSGLKSPLASIA